MLTCPACGESNRPAARYCTRCGAALTGVAPVPTAAGLTPGAMLQGRFRIERVLGQGGFGAAYLATDVRLKRSCAVKQMLIPPGATNADINDLKAAFEREADALVSLNHPGHPNIPDIYDYFSDALGNFLVMKYIEGESLEGRLLRLGGKMPVEQAIAIGAAIADALTYLHSRQPSPIMHRDIKPANILLDTDGRAWLVDFGLSKAQPQSGGTIGLSEPIGTLGYAPPEQYKIDGSQPVPRSDVFALAVMLYEMLTGDQPADHPLQFPRLHLLPAAVRAVLAPCLELDPARRPDSSQLKTKLELLARPDAGPPFRWQQQNIISRQPVDLVAVADAHWDEARSYFTDGTWMKWFKDLHRNDLIAQLQQSRANNAHDDIALDAFLRMLDPGFAPPRLQVDRVNLDAGVLAWQSQSTLALELRNTGSGCLAARLSGLPGLVGSQRHRSRHP